MGDNSFEFNIPPFLGLHPIFNVDLLWPYFPTLFDTSKIAEQLTPTKLKTDCIQHASNDQIMDTHIKGTWQWRIQLYWVIKEGQLLHQGKWLTQGQIQQKFPHLMGGLNEMEWIPLLPNEGDLIQVDISGHPPIPTGSKQFVGNLLFLAFFRVWNFRGHFEGLNDVFSQLITSMIVKESSWSSKINLLIDTFPTRYCAPQTEIVCQRYAPKKLIHQTTQNDVHKTVGFSSFGVRVLDFLYDKKAFETSL